MRRLGALLPALCVVLLTVIAAARVAAQTPAQRGRLIVTVTDTTGGILPTARVTLTGNEQSNRSATLAPLVTTGAGIAIFDNLVPGRYLVSAEFPGFETSKPKDVRVRAGDNRETLVLALARLEDTVTVGRDQQEAGSDRASTFGTMLGRDQIDQLSDDPDIMRQQLEDLAGPGMTIAVDSFEGGQLPNKSQIRSIRISRDQFAAESHFAGGLRVEIITQPGAGEIRGNASTSFYTSALDGRNPLVGVTPKAGNQNGFLSLSGGLLKDRMSFSVNMTGNGSFDTPVQASSASAGTSARALSGVKARTGRLAGGASFDLALTRNQTLRMGFNRMSAHGRDQGVATYDGPERTYSTDDTGTSLQVGHTGPVGRRTMLYNRFYMSRSTSTQASAFEGLTYIVPDDLNRGGAQRRGGTNTTGFGFNSDMDHVRGRHSFRTGIEVTGLRFRSDQESNYVGTYYFEGPEAFAAGQPRSFTKRIGDPNIRYANTQVSLYFQDDVRLSKTLTMTPGLRYEVQTHVKDYNNVMPRFGVTWAPAGGKTTYRVSLGVFYDWLSTGVYQQTLQIDGFRMQEVNVAHPPYPDPGPLGAAPPGNKYVLSPDLVLPRTTRASLGISHNVSALMSLSGVYAYTRGIGQFIGENLNAPVNGVRPDPAFANVIRAVSAGRSEAHSGSATLSLNLAGLGSNPQTGPWFSWRRGLRVSGSYGYGRTFTDTDGPFSTPATDLASEWGPAAGDIRHRASISFGTTMIRGLSASMGFNGTSGRPLTIRTGVDDNGDLIYNDRPVGVGRNSVRVPGQWSSNASFGYSIPLGSRQVSSGGGVSISNIGGILTANMNTQPQPRYRLSLSVSIQNLLNRANWTGYSGVMTSRNFMQPTIASGVRRVNLNVGLSF